MDELERELGALADSYRPDRQPPLDSLVARSVRRRRRAAVATSALAVVAVAGAAFALSGSDRTTVAPPVASDPPSPSPTAAAPVGCGNIRVQGIVDYIDFVKVGGLLMASAQTYGVPASARQEDLGQAVERVTCSLEEETHGTGSTERMDDGTASFLPVGATISEVRGFDPRCRVAAPSRSLTAIGVQDVYLASIPDATTHQPAPCAVMPGLDPDTTGKVPGDYRWAPAAYREREDVPSCGSYTYRGAADDQVRAAVDCFSEYLSRDQSAELQVAALREGEPPVYTVLRSVHGTIERWQSGWVDGEGSEVYWRHSTCDGSGGAGLGEGCTSAG